jgi:uncharacterized protein (DUF608 family)
MNNQKNNSGALFKNNKTKDGQPDYTGTMIIDSKEYRVSGWVNKSKSGMAYLRLLLNESKTESITPAAHQSSLPVQSGTDNTDSVDDLPF